MIEQVFFRVFSYYDETLILTYCSNTVVFSLCTVLGNYISQSYINWNARHPKDPKRPLIYWDAVLVLLPAQLGGANLGNIVKQALPDTVLIILAMVVLIYAGIKTLRKGLKLWKLEQNANDAIQVSYFVNV